jgi:hypothetical protein
MLSSLANYPVSPAMVPTTVPVVRCTDDVVSPSLTISTVTRSSPSDSNTITYISEPLSSDNSFIKVGGTLKRNKKAVNEIWEYFRIYHEKQFQIHAFCILCNKDVNYGKTHSTSSLEKHMRSKHAKEYQVVMSERTAKRLCVEENKSNAIVVAQAKVTEYVVPSPNFQDHLIKWLYTTFQPLSVVEQASFRDMISSLNKKSPLMGKEKVRSLLSTKYYEVLHRITSILKGKYISLTTDAWTSIAKVGYVTCTVHFIEPKSWTLHHFALGIFKKDGASTAADVVSYTEQHMKNFNVWYPSLTCVVTDTESTMVAAGRSFKSKAIEEGGETSWHGCIDHTLELVTKLAFKDTHESVGTMTACRALVNFFNSSSQATSKLKMKSKARLGVALTVIQDVCTRWWSTYSMCERLLRLKNILGVMHLDGDIRLSLSEAQWTVIHNMTVLLKPFMVAQKLLEGESYVTISLIPYILYKIRSGLTSAINDPASSAQVCRTATAMLQKFSEEFGSGVEDTVAVDYMTEGNRRRSKGIPKLVLLSVFLDPRTKSAIGIPPADREVIWQLLEVEAVNVALAMGPPIPAAVAPVAAPGIVMNRNNMRHGAVAERYTADVNEFLHDLITADDDVDDINDDDLQELIDAHDVNDGCAADNNDNWNRETAQRVVQLEIDEYKATPGISLCCTDTGHFSCPLQWWRLHQFRFPHLSKLALKFLAIPATSAPSERVFSTAGLTIAKDRARLESDRANELVFLHDSVPSLEYYDEITNSL